MNEETCFFWDNSLYIYDNKMTMVFIKLHYFAEVSMIFDNKMTMAPVTEQQKPSEPPEHQKQQVINTFFYLMLLGTNFVK